MTACPACAAENAEGARFCPACGGAHGEDRGGARGERKIVTVLFADVGRLDRARRADGRRAPEGTVMAGWFAAMREEIEAHGGTVEKFIGDAVMAAFGGPRRARGRPRARGGAGGASPCGRAAPGAERRARPGATEAAIGGARGGNTGEVVAAPGRGRRGEAMATGDAVNVAARLEAAAAPGQILIAERTGARLPRPGPARGRPPRPGNAAARRRCGPSRSRRHTAPRRAAGSRGSGRRWSAATPSSTCSARSTSGRPAGVGRPHLCTLYGEPGVGKSRLVRELVARLEGAESGPG